MTRPTVLQYQTIRSPYQCHSVGRSVLHVLSSCVRRIKMDNCSNVSSSYKDLAILESALNGTGVLVCSLAIILSFVLRLHKLLTYRLAIYQVSSSLAFGTLSILNVVRYFVENDDSPSSLCLVHAYLKTYTLMVKYLFTIIITVHLFFFAVCYINLKRLEVCYLVISLVVPAPLAAIPFVTKTYGPQVSGSPWCWIMQKDDCSRKMLTSGVIEIYGLLRTYLYQPACRLVVDINHARRAGIQDMRGTWCCNEEQDSSQADATSDGLSDYILRSHVNFNGDIYIRRGWSGLREEQGTPICE